MRFEDNWHKYKQIMNFDDIWDFLLVTQLLDQFKIIKAGNQNMKTVEQLKSEIFREVESSGYLKNVSAQIKTHVLQIIDRETQANKYKMGFQYEHPVLKKLRNYPLTSLCMDLIQEFLESFKFKHTLNVFKKQINRELTINRNALKKEFSIDLSGKDQAILLSIVGQIVNGDVRVIEKERAAVPKNNNYLSEEDLKGRNKQKNYTPAGQDTSAKTNTTTTTQQKKQAKKPEQPFYYDIPKEEGKKKDPDPKQIIKQTKKAEAQQEAKKQEAKAQQEALEKQKQKEKAKGKKGKKQEQKPPEGATDLLADVVSKFAIKKNEKPSADEEYKARKAFSEQKAPKKVVPEESGSNKIRGISMGKNPIGGIGGSTASSFMKFSSFNQPQPQSQVEDQEDSFQQSRDSTRRNPLYSSGQSGFDKSYGFDQSVDDSMAIEEYEYVERAKKFGKKY